jgi:iron complex outermembrane recepter protein
LRTSLRGVTPDPTTKLFIVGQDPEHQYSLRSSISIGPRWDWDVFARNRSEISSVPLPSATQLDTRIAWRPTLDIEVAIVGRNLVGTSAVEGTSELFDLGRVAIERDAYLQLRWSFR